MNATAKGIVILTALLFLPNYPIAGQEKTKAVETTILRESIKSDVKRIWEAPGQDAELRVLKALAANLPSWRFAADKQWPEGQFLLGKCCQYGVNFPQEPKEAVKWYRKAADQNYPPAQSQMGFCYANGQGVPRDMAEAVRWYRKAAEQGLADTQTLVGWCYANGQGVLKDEAEAAKWYRKAADQGFADAQYQTGWCYASGLGVAKDEAEAVKWYRKAAEQNHAGAQHKLYACYSNGQGVAKDEAEATKWCRKAAERGVVDAQYALLNKQYEKLYQEGKYPDALSVARQVLELAEKYTGPDHACTAASLNNLAVVYYNMGDYAKSEPLYVRSVKIREKTLGPDHPDTATCIDNLAMLYNTMGDYTKAEPLCRRALTIREKALGPEHFNTSVSLNNLALIYDNMGDRAKAASLYQRSLKIKEKALDSNHPDIANTVNNLALVYENMGEYAKAELMFQRALAIYEKTFGPGHLHTANSLGSLALLYQILGDNSKAEQLFQRSLAIREKVLGPDHSHTAASLNNLANLYDSMGDYLKAEPLCRRSLAIREKVLGSNHPSTADSLDVLAWIYKGMHDYTKAEPMFKRALAVREKTLGPNNTYTAKSLSHLGSLYADMGDYAKTESFYQRSLQIYEKVLGPDHPHTALSLANLAVLQLELGRSDVALSLAVKHRATVEKNLGTILAFTSEHQRMEYQRDKSAYYILATLGSAPDIAEGVLRTKGVVLDSLLEDQLAAVASKNPEIKSMVDQLRVAGRRLTQFQIEVPKTLSPEAQKHQQAEREVLEQQVEDLQKALARNVAGMGQSRRSLRINTPDVQAVLPTNAILMEFVRYSHYVDKGKFERRYGVVLIGGREVAFKDGKPGEPVWVPLGPANIIEKSLKEYGSMMRGKRESGISLLHKLYTQLFEPIQKRLPKDITTLIISPDAELNFVSFATFVDDQDKFLAEKFTLNYVASGRDLVLKRTSKKASRRFAAFANPAFGEKPMMAGTRSTNAVQLAMLSSDQRDYRGEILTPLPYTMKEAQFLRDRSSSWNIDGSVFAGAEASEAEVKVVKSPYILHLATHGFFLPDTMTTNSTTGRQLLSNDRAPIVPHNPMQRSGLAFAGAQLTLDAWKRGETPDTENDGILMGQEIGTMDLKETWLVVLSACDTGIGEARAGEGVLGLRRGFIQAGAQNLLMTLWPVSDEHTVGLMKAFYERALKDNNAPQALAEVQRQWLVRLRQEEDILTAVRRAGPFILTFQGSN